MDKNKFNFYKSPSNNKKYIYALVAVLALGSLTLSQLILPSNAKGYSFYSYYPSTSPYTSNSSYSYSSPYSYSNSYSSSPSASYTTQNSNYSNPYSSVYSGNPYSYSSNSNTLSSYSSYYSPYSSYSYSNPYTSYSQPSYSYGNYNSSPSYYQSGTQTTSQSNISQTQNASNSQANLTSLQASYPAGTLVPQFNIYTPYTHTKTAGHDYYLLDVKNDSQVKDWGVPFVASPGDVLTFSVYYHNGVIDSVAYNTILRVALPSGMNFSQNVTAYLWADNAGNATPSNPMTQSLPVSISVPAALEFIPGSVTWYPNQTDSRFNPPAPFLFGQTGDELIGQGLRVGDIVGCWEYSGYVNFKVRVGQPVPPDLQITKTGKNLSQNQYDWTDTVFARPSQRIAFLIKVQVNGGSIAKSVTLWDLLPNQMTYVPGTLTINGVSAGTYNNFGTGPTTTLNLGDIAPGQTLDVYFEANTRDPYVFPQGDTTIINTASVQAFNVSTKQDTATIIVKSICDPNESFPGSR